MKGAWPRDVYSLDPSVFDYATGNWKRRTYSLKIGRKVKKGDTAAVPFDEVDLKILTILKRSAATSSRAMAAATGLSVDDALFHLREHVLGGGDPKKSMILKYYVDFLEPGLFAPDIAILTVVAEPRDGSEGLLNEVASIPYVSVIWQGEKTLVNMYVPLQGLYAITHEVGTIGARLNLKDLTGYISPWYYWNVLGSLHAAASLERNFKNGKWAFKREEVVEAITARVMQAKKG
ncbi:AsnC family protein [Tardisphaera miroshnichenkoae]